MLKAVVDTNVFVSGLLRGPISRLVIEALRDSKFTLIISQAIFDEILEVISRPKFHNVITTEIIREFTELLKTQAVFVKPVQKLNIIIKDPNDNRFLEAAIVGKVDCIVSGDKHLLNIGSYRAISILSPTKFLKLFVKQ